MKEFLKADEDVKKLYDMVYAPMYTKTLFAGIELDVFSQLEEPKTYIEIAEKLELHPHNTKYFLDALASMDLLTKNRGLYKNGELSSKYLVRSSDFFIGTLIRIYSRVSGFDDLDILKLVKEGPNSGYENKSGLESQGIFSDYGDYDDYIEMLKNSQRIGRAYDYTNIVASLPEFKGFKKMLDLGGGPGLIGMAIIKKHPDMTGVVFEASSVAGIAVETIKEYNLGKRVEVLVGDYMVDSIGDGYDFILASGTLNFAKQDMDKIIKKIYDALNPNGVFMCISEGLVNERTKPKEIIIGWLPSFLKGCDFSLVQGEVSDAALRNGFKNVHKRTIDSFMGELDIDIARK
jgi:SAM-dependent methyltransferase